MIRFVTTRQRLKAACAFTKRHFDAPPSFVVVAKRRAKTRNDGREFNHPTRFRLDDDDVAREDDVTR